MGEILSRLYESALLRVVDWATPRLLEGIVDRIPDRFLDNLVNRLPDSVADKLVSKLPSDAAIDLFARLPQDDADRLLQRLSEDTVADLIENGLEGDFVDDTAPEVPAFTPVSGFDFGIPEDTAVGTIVGTLSSEEGASFALADGSPFTLDGANVVLAEALDYETATQVSVTATATDAAGNTSDPQLATLNLSVVDVDDTAPHPPFLKLAFEFEFAIPENTPIGTVIGTLSGEEGASFALVDGSPFTLDGANVVLAEALDYEVTGPQVLITPIAIDAAGNASDTELATLGLRVLDVDDTAPDNSAFGHTGLGGYLETELTAKDGAKDDYFGLSTAINDEDKSSISASAYIHEDNYFL